jgi:hypothetical protein
MARDTVDAERPPGDPLRQGRYEYDSRAIRLRYGNDPATCPDRKRR